MRETVSEPSFLIVDDHPLFLEALQSALDAGEGDLERAAERVRRQVDEIGTSYRVPGEQEARLWPVSPVPLLINALEWDGIAAAVMQRAELLDMILADLYGGQRLVSSGALPAAAVTGCPHFLRPMVGIKPKGGHFLNIYAADLARDPAGISHVSWNWGHGPRADGAT